MGLIASDKGGSNFPPMPAGLKLAICYGVYDLGHHFDEKWGKTSHKCVIIWEVPGERIDIKDKETGAERNLPRAISINYTLSLNEKANLRKDLESWRGCGFTADELKGFDIKSILGRACQLQIVHKPSTDGTKIYANISSIVQAPKGEKPQAENSLQYFSFEDDMDIPDNTPKWIRETIERSDEYRHFNRQSIDMPPIDQTPPPPDPSRLEDNNDDLPF